MSKYDEDFYAWTQEQAEYLRAGLWNAVDAVHIAEEIEDVGREQRHAVESHLTSLLMHLLKWRYQAGRRSRSWRVSIRNARIEIHKRWTRRVEDEMEMRFIHTYANARKLAMDETGLPLDTFPEACTWRREQILDEDFLPEA
ncbi:MAG: DUF29 domain-containing protein [Candidatus Tectomicrobia bacterium]|nr:DUF29 domain-containing protein [Candidatus Tectomicrobia bacterium]